MVVMRSKSMVEPPKTRCAELRTVHSSCVQVVALPTRSPRCYRVHPPPSFFTNECNAAQQAISVFFILARSSREVRQFQGSGKQAT